MINIARPTLIFTLSVVQRMEPASSPTADEIKRVCEFDMWVSFYEIDWQDITCPSADFDGVVRL